MSKLLNILDKITRLTREGLLLILVLVLIWGIIQLQKCNEKETYIKPDNNKNEISIKKEIYRPPVVKTPVTPDKPPIEKKELPIHPKLIKRTIEIKTETPEGRTIKTVLIVNKKDEIYAISEHKTKVTVTEWKPKFIAPEFKFGYSLVASDKIYHCLSLDYIHIWRIYLGSEIGVGVRDRYFSGYLVGLSLKYRIWELSSPETSFLFSLVAGYNFINSKPYVGVNLKF